MDAIDAQEIKLTKMHSYIANCRAGLSATEHTELAKRLRQYWSASTNQQNYLEKIKWSEQETQRVLKSRAKSNNIFFVAAILIIVAMHYLNFIDDDNKIMLGVGLAAYFVVKEFAYQLEANNNAIKIESWKVQVDFYTHEMSCCGGQYVEYREEYFGPRIDDEDIELKKNLRMLYLLSAEIAILHGLKSTVQSVDF